jgi:hypothetical protein
MNDQKDEAIMSLARVCSAQRMAIRDLEKENETLKRLLSEKVAREKEIREDFDALLDCLRAGALALD